MAYKIEYAKSSMHRYPQIKKRSSLKIGRVMLVAFLLMVAIWMHVNGIPDFLIPGDAAVTREAVSILIEDVECGVPVKVAITTFCRQIIEGAEN